MYSHAFKAKLRHLAADEAGSGLVEFTASAILLFTVVFGIMETGRALYVDNFVSNGAREAVRYAVVRGASWSGTSCSTAYASACDASAANVATYVNTLAPAGVSTSANNLTVKTTWSGLTPSGASCTATGITNSPGCTVQVKVSYNFNFIMPFLPANTLALSSSSAMAISQ